jgi:hypothetical protein
MSESKHYSRRRFKNVGINYINVGINYINVGKNLINDIINPELTFTSGSHVPQLSAPEQSKISGFSTISFDLS